ERSRFEFPAFDCVDSGLVETERQRLQDLNVLHGAGLVDDALDDDDAGDARLAGHFGINRLDAIDYHGRFDVAADAQWRFALRRGIGHDTADHAADDAAHH